MEREDLKDIGLAILVGNLIVFFAVFLYIFVGAWLDLGIIKFLSLVGANGISASVLFVSDLVTIFVVFPLAVVSFSYYLLWNIDLGKICRIIEEWSG